MQLVDLVTPNILVISVGLLFVFAACDQIREPLLDHEVSLFCKFSVESSRILCLVIVRREIVFFLLSVSETR